MKKAKFRLVENLGTESLYSLAKKTKIDYKTIHKHATGKSASIRHDHLIKICNTLNCTPDALYGFTPKD